MNNAVKMIVGALLGKLPRWFIVFIISMIPILELRGSILAAGFMDVKFFPTYAAAVVGNMLPIPFILVFITRIFDWMKKREKLGKIAVKFEEKAMSKSDDIKKYGKLGLFIFVAIPLPGTGAWTGSLAAVLLGIKPKDAFVPILLGVMTAGLIMSLISFGIIKSII